MMRFNPKSYTVAGQEKDTYLANLDNALGALAIGFANYRRSSQIAAIQKFGEQEKWDWDRLPPLKSTYPELARRVQRVREEYRWLAWQDSQPRSADNYGFFEELDISLETGLPWVHDFARLNDLKKNIDENRRRIPPYASLAESLCSLLTSDAEPAESVEAKAMELHKQAMRLNYLDRLDDRQLIGWSVSNDPGIVTIGKVLQMGAEENFHLTKVAFSGAKGMFHVYLIDLWQDPREAQITETDRGLVMSYALRQKLNFSELNAAWYILSSIDEAFKSLHPVHVTRAVIGPYENKYQTQPKDIEQLAATKDFLKTMPDSGLLRASVQYTYAPNYKANSMDTQQIYYQEDWRDEFIVCPPGTGKQISGSVLGDHVYIIEG